MARHDERSDDELLAAWKTGEAPAGVSLVERHHESVARFFLHKAGANEGPDLAQATFLGLLEGIGRFRGAASFRTWLFAVARNVLLKYLRNRCRDQQRFRPGETTLAALGPSPPSLLAADQNSRLLAAALRRLPIDTQLMLELHYWEKLPIAEIAVVLDKPEGTVKTRMHRGRKQLEVEMEALAESPEQLETTRRGLEDWAESLRRDLDS